VHARVSAILYRTVEVEQAMIQRGGTVLPRRRRRLPVEGLDPDYSDTYIPTEVEYLDYAGEALRWELLGRVTPPAEVGRE
jgi:hypothetical protein